MTTALFTVAVTGVSLAAYLAISLCVSDARGQPRRWVRRSKIGRVLYRCCVENAADAIDRYHDSEPYIDL